MYRINNSPERATDTDADLLEIVNRLDRAYRSVIARLDRKNEALTADRRFWRWAHIVVGLVIGYAMWGA